MADSKTVSQAGTSVENCGRELNDGFFGDACPRCFGHLVKGRQCQYSCEYGKACAWYTYDNKGERSRQRKWEDYQTVPLNEDIEITNEDGDIDNIRAAFELEDGELIDPSDINTRLIQFFIWFTIEHPMSAKAIALRIDPNVQSLQDVADILHITKQAVHKRIANELGLEKRNYKVDDFMKLSGIQLDVYRLCIKENKSTRQAAEKLGVSHTTIRKILKKISGMGFWSREGKDGK